MRFPGGKDQAGNARGCSSPDSCGFTGALGKAGLPGRARLYEQLWLTPKAFPSEALGRFGCLLLQRLRRRPLPGRKVDRRSFDAFPWVDAWAGGWDSTRHRHDAAPSAASGVLGLPILVVGSNTRDLGSHDTPRASRAAENIPTGPSTRLRSACRRPGRRTTTVHHHKSAVSAEAKGLCRWGAIYQQRGVAVRSVGGP